MNRFSPSWSIARKDINALKASLQLWLPMIIVPLVFSAVLPAILLLVFRYKVLPGGSGGFGSSSDIAYLLKSAISLAPPSLQAELSQLPSDGHRVLYFMLTYLMAPMFLLIPVMTSSIITANSFAGEKERKTLEGLLYAPISMNQLLLGKGLAAFLPSIALTLGSFVVYGVIVNSLAYPLFSHLIFPTWNWLPLLLLVVPSLTAVIVLATMLVSAKVKGFQEAYQLGGVIVLPVLALVAGQATGMLLLGNIAMLALTSLLVLIGWILFRSARHLALRHRFLEKLG
ncbi:MULTISPECIES: ABC transporter permease subunit [unclassified Paenibacillus]|uniref:ABC transporter permease subunit n=1 Tax=unclassified Paenibacillus TaxID=185978 RepID=UPI0009551765|nr:MULTISPECIES: ABC transporter permease subunit [unclassified Paenibacillus]ASS66064.1 ABC transporter permease subunit [Paenibacillus sp. RUD330]SIQ13703.1 ABC-2 family transporter protein [Paenibacillus sp. RU4X]SIQ35520.1 ABC-2 family transporter protein [Paenibacillus sp. RU4T]